MSINVDATRSPWGKQKFKLVGKPHTIAIEKNGYAAS